MVQQNQIRDYRCQFLIYMGTKTMNWFHIMQTSSLLKHSLTDFVVSDILIEY